ncbi:L-isoaspartate O-methyltransferase (macronuclear) [Tetrahymena thermophila SB210]|uniref:L-isoaspartate O-methyltransferase n=1 Tax=Tetrahymena thermophila (strain SB210) TaxID=312017 RepID=W7X538_TETTS|nr:L-isoaspartate O-methyltransferase [Tetrahymena thermophila SB210]EWS72522.1 L-isoaspartate O-methyltransferase [Tetrahymena thermophila SB210]|eukprot:XP_012654958.1 L-isoaspartate O-methyltransferase [Tetrahymena thermophila SB210]
MVLFNNKSDFISFQNIQYQISKNNKIFQKKSNKKQILHNLSGYFKSGLNAILGSSGAGKTTFLNILAKRIEKNDNNDLNGTLKINNQNYDADSFSKFSGYVMQEDLLLSNLTVKEYITFAADIRLSLPKEVKSQRIYNIIKQLKLEHCQDTIIGDQNSKGISGKFYLKIKN